MKHIPQEFAVIALVLLVLSGASLAEKKSKTEKQQGTLDEYMKQLAAPAPTSFATTRGSLFSSSGLLADPYSDFKAHLVGDSISIQILESTTISQSGQTPSFLNPLLAANSSTTLKGTGAAASQSSLNTVLTAQVVAVLPSGSLVVEACRQVMANQQHENVVLRGVVRPADISPNNSVFSYQISNLQLEVKGKGVISDSVRQPNIVMRTLLKIIGF
jgi:flagellar L-ring protein precursor FlgH